MTGPRVEAQLLHVQQQKLVERSALSTPHSPFVIWDVGLGAAANAISAIEALQKSSSHIEIHSFDRTTGPLEFALSQATELGYVVGHENSLRELMDRHQTELRPGLSWRFHSGDFSERVLDASIPAPHAILYDPYSPTTNIDMWTLAHFRTLRARLEPEKSCLLTNYTCSTAVRVTLLLAGFHVGIGWGVGEKAETTIATNAFSLLERPLDNEWLKRVRVSHSAAPLLGAPRTIAAISDADFDKLSARPQFARGT